VCTLNALCAFARLPVRSPIDRAPGSAWPKPRLIGAGRELCGRPTRATELATMLALVGGVASAGRCVLHHRREPRVCAALSCRSDIYSDLSPSSVLFGGCGVMSQNV
jgi:hypothetical protein